MEIVPIEEDFVIEAKLSPADVGFVHINQDATVKVDAFDYTIYGNLEGRVVYISADCWRNEQAMVILPIIELMFELRVGGLQVSRIGICKFCRIVK